MRAGIDFGISFTDIAVAADGQTPSLHHFPSQSAVNAERVRELLQLAGSSLDQLQSLAVTGGHSAVLPNSLDSVPVHKINEVNALGAGALALLATTPVKMPVLVLNSGSGTTCILINGEGDYVHVGGSAVGGGTLVGLARLALDIDDPLEIEELSKAGKTTAVDLRIDEVVSNPIGTLPPDATAVNFGQLIHSRKDIAREDAAAGLSNLIGQSVALTGLSTALSLDIATICVIGRTPRLGGVRLAMDRIFDLPIGSSKEVIYPDLGPSACALGALAHSCAASLAASKEGRG